MTNLEHKIIEVIEDDMAYNSYDYQVNIEQNVDISFSRGITKKNIKAIEDKCNLEFVGVLPYQRYGGASWICLSFKTR